MDIEKIVSEIVGKITGNNDLIGKFKADPAAIIKQLTGLDVNADQIKEIVSGVMKAIGSGAGDVVKEGSGLISKIMGFFRK